MNILRADIRRSGLQGVVDYLDEQAEAVRFNTQEYDRLCGLSDTVEEAIADLAGYESES
jgi:hypothetical protein